MFHMIQCIALINCGVYLAFIQKLPKRITGQVPLSTTKGKIALIMREEGLQVKGCYAISPSDGRLAVTSRWVKFVEGNKLAIGAKVKVELSICLVCTHDKDDYCGMTLMKFMYL